MMTTTTANSKAGNNSTKLAALVSERIVRDIAEAGWPEGDVFGSETELLERYGVSRAVFREAIRIVEHQRIARMRRGPGGGLVVTPLDVGAVVDALVVYLDFARARVDHVLEARLALEQTVATLAPVRLREDDIDALRDLAEREQAGTVNDERELHTTLATITKNPALAFCVDLLSRLTARYTPKAVNPRDTTRQAVIRAHLAIIESAIAGDDGLTRHRMRRHLEAEASYIRRQAKEQSGARLLKALRDDDKLAERVARELFDEVSDADWPVGRALGSEPHLMERFGVSRAVLREAVRILEHHQVAVMRRGPGGGLFVVEPGVEAIVGAITLLIDRGGVSAIDLFEVRTAVELAAIDLAIERLDDDAVAALRGALENERAAATLPELGVVGHDLHDVLVGIPANPVLELLGLVLTRLTRIHQSEVPGRVASSAEVRRTHAGIVQAIIDRDVGLARHRMRNHLSLLRAWVK